MPIQKLIVLALVTPYGIPQGGDSPWNEKGLISHGDIPPRWV